MWTASKSSNTRIGHAAGDDLLTQVALRLQRCARQGELVARLGGDEFTILLSDLPDLGVATTAAERIAAQLQEAVPVSGHSLVVARSIGIAIGSTGEDSPIDLLRKADLALYAARDAGTARRAVFNSILDADSLRRLDRDFTGRGNTRAA